MKSIYASKLYIASSRKDRIHAALSSPSNLALVQQLAEDLDDQYQVPENLGAEPKEETKPASDSEGADDFDEFKVDEEIDPKNDLVTMNDLKSHAPSSSGHSSSHSSESKSESDKPSESKESKADTSDLMPESPANEQKPSEPAEASTRVTSNTIADLSVLKSTLNSREDTAGVTRISKKENEIWIYYNDDVNLNNIMTNVIEYLMNNSYEQFEFNRLARSDNAIVFVNVIQTPDLLQVDLSDK